MPAFQYFNPFKQKIPLFLTNFLLLAEESEIEASRYIQENKQQVLVLQQ